MRAMVLRQKAAGRLIEVDAARGEPGPGQLRIKVHACGVCRTDLHVVDGDLTEPKLPIVPGHEIVGRVDAVGTGVDLHQPAGRLLAQHHRPHHTFPP